jgi:superfamily II DNA or RNA helicase
MAQVYQGELFSQYETARCSLLLDDNRLLVIPARTDVMEYLTFVEKKMELVATASGRPRRQTTRTQKPFFVLIRDSVGAEAIQTYAGMWKRVYDFLREKGVEVRFSDLRKPFPAPKLERMCGFRYSQEDLLRRALALNMSGLICAPTRYGKSTLIANTCRAYPGVRTVILMPGVELLEQQLKDFKKALPHRKIVHIGGPRSAQFQNDDITLCLMDDTALARLDAADTQLVLIDEPHTLVTDCQLSSYVNFENARKLGYGATITGRYDNRDVLIEGTIGPVLVNKTFPEARDEGAVAPIIVFMLEVPLTGSIPSDRLQAYKSRLYEDGHMAANIAAICKSIIPPNWQTLMFIANEKQALFYNEHIEGSEIAMAKTMNGKQRLETQRRMVENELMRCLSTNIYATGVTFSDLRVVINLAGGGGNALSIQKPGRVAEVRPGKRCGVVIDVLFSAETGGGAKQLAGESWARYNMYKERGYDLRIVRTMGELREAFNRDCL